MLIRELVFQNFKTIKDKVELKNLKNINYFIGQNGVGKSNIFLAIKKISNNLRENVIPESICYFDNDPNEELSLGFTVELSIEERNEILQYFLNDTPLNLDLDKEKTLQFIKYEFTCRNNVKIHEILSVSNAEGKFQVVIELTQGSENKFNVSEMKLSTFISNRYSISTQLTISEIQNDPRKIATTEILTIFNSTLFDLLNIFFNQIVHIPNFRESQSSQIAKEERNISINGTNLPNELHTRSDDREEYKTYEKEVKNISFGINEVFSPIEGTSSVIKIKEEGLKNKIDFSEISSGFHQTLILTNILQHILSKTVLIEEPELHLNAKSQKQLSKLIKKQSKNKQYFIETHSPIFTGINEHESTYLISKYVGVANILQINKENIKQIKIELGISQADIFDNDYMCFVEGSSEYVAFPIIAKKLGYDLGYEFGLWNLGGYGNIKNIKALLNYLKSSERKTFLLLDKNSEATKLVENIIQNNLIEKSMCRSLDGNFEDPFPSKLIIEKMNEIAVDLKIKFELSATELEEKRSSRGVDSILTEYWNKNIKKVNDFPKRKLAIKMAESISNNEIGNNEFAKIVKTILDKFGIEPSQ